MIIHGGYDGNNGDDSCKDTFALDCDMLTWSQLADSPEFRQWHSAIYRSAGHSMIVCGGFNRGWFDAYNAFDYSVLNLTSGMWTTVTTTGGPPLHPEYGDRDKRRYGIPLAYDSATDSMFLMGGEGKGYPILDNWRLSFSGSNWVSRAIPLGATQYAHADSFDGCVYVGGGAVGALYSIYSVADDSWSSVSPDNQPVSIYYPTVTISDSGLLFMCASDTDNAFGRGHFFVYSVVGVVVGGQEAGVDPSTIVGWGLYACDDHLPTSNGVFESIYEFTSEPGVCKFATLNDRVVITEGIAAPPLVWAGAMADNASDWPHPKAVLIAQDGERFYDVSSEVCDKDVDTVAQVGNIRPWGAIYVCTDMPEIEGFYFDMESPNTGVAETTANTYYTPPSEITAAADASRQDLKGVVTNWVQSAGATGHFTDGTDAISIGSGNYLGAWSGATTYVIGDTVSLSGVRYWCILGHTNHTPPDLTYWRVNNPDVVPGIAVDLGDGEYLIAAVTNGGVGAAEVTLSATHANATVSAAYGLTVAATGLSINLGYQTGVTSWEKTLAGNTSLAGYSIRIVVPGSEIASSGDHIKLRLKGPTVDYTDAYPTGFGAHPTRIKSVSIVERSGSTGNGTTTPTEVKFPSPNYSPSLGLTVSGTTIGALNQEVESAATLFTVDETKDYLVTIDVGWTTFSQKSGVSAPDPVSGMRRQLYTYIRSGALPSVAGTSYVKDYGWGNDGASSTLQTVTGFTEVPFIYGLDKLTVTGVHPVSSGLQVATTTNASQVASGAFEGVNSITVDQVTAGSSETYHAVSSDGRATFWVFIGGAWRQIVRETAGSWQYNNSATTTPSWQNPTVGSLHGALRQAFADSHNQMDKTAFESVTAAQWETFFIPHITSTLNFAVGMLADGDNVPVLFSYVVAYESGGQAIIEGFKDGDWAGGDGWTDNTIVDGSRLGQSGSIMYAGASPFKADYHVVDQVPGYWFRLLTNGTSPDCAITRIRYKAPCQPLANIGDGQPDTPLGFIYQDASTSSIRDFNVEVSDNVLTELSKADIPMQPEDFLFVGYITRFNEIEITPYTDNNQEASVLSAEYWNGETWAPLTATDCTIGSAGNTLAQKGKISWTLPTDWKTSIPFNSAFTRGYWVRLFVSGALTSTAAISEVRIYGVPDALKKHQFAATFQNRIVLGNRPDASDQVDISRADEEYGFTGQDSASYRVGGTDSIQCAISAWNGLLIGKTETWHQLIGSSSGDFQFESVEAARHVPINSQCVVKAPVGGFDYGDRYGLFFVNRYGAFVSTGLHVDSLWNTSRGKTISDVLNWWDTSETPRLDLDYLHLACGEYWPARNWIVWAVPMILSEGSGPQASNNRLIVYDLTLGAWLPPFTISAASLCTAYHYNPNAPGKLGDLGLYAGDYQGRVIRLFGPGVTSDLGCTISAWVETGWLDFGSPEYRKLLRMLSLYGKTADDAITVSAFADGDTSVSTVAEFHDLSNLGNKTFALEQESHNVQGRFFKFRIAFNDASEVFGLQISTSLTREWGAL